MASYVLATGRNKGILTFHDPTTLSQLHDLDLTDGAWQSSSCGLMSSTALLSPTIAAGSVSTAREGGGTNLYPIIVIDIETRDFVSGCNPRGSPMSVSECSYDCCAVVGSRMGELAYLLVGGNDKCVLFDVASRRRLSETGEISAPYAVTCLEWRRWVVVTGCSHSKISIHDPERDLSTLAVIKSGHRNNTFGLHKNEEYKLMISSSAGKMLKVWDLRDLKTEQEAVKVSDEGLEKQELVPAAEAMPSPDQKYAQRCYSIGDAVYVVTADPCIAKYDLRMIGSKEFATPVWRIQPGLGAIFYSGISQINDDLFVTSSDTPGSDGETLVSWTSRGKVVAKNSGVPHYRCVATGEWEQIHGNTGDSAEILAERLGFLFGMLEEGKVANCRSVSLDGHRLWGVSKYFQC